MEKTKTLIASRVRVMVVAQVVEKRHSVQEELGSNPKTDLGFFILRIDVNLLLLGSIFSKECVINSSMLSCSPGGLGLIPSSRNIQMLLSLLT